MTDTASLFDLSSLPGDVPSGAIDPVELEKARYLAMMRLGLGMAGREPLGASASGAIKAYALAQGNARQNMLAQLQAYKLRQEVAAKAKADQQGEVLGTDLKDIFSSRIAASGGPTNANAAIAGNATLAAIAQYRQAAARLMMERKFEDAKRASDIADGMEEQYFAPVDVKTPEGAIRMAQFGKRGGQRVSDLAPAKPLHFGDAGSALVGADPFTGAVQATIPKTLSPEGRISAGSLSVSQQRLAFDREQAELGTPGAYEGGIFRVPKVGPATPVVTAAGTPLQPTMPATIKAQIAQNNVNLHLTAQAIKAVQAYPGAFGPGNIVGDFVTQRTDPKGVPARAAVANLASQKFHDRSGANITASESPRLKPFIPDSNDEAPVVITKLQGFQRESLLMNQELASGKAITDVAGIDAGGLPPDIQAAIDRANAAKGNPPP